ncbi:MAG: pyridoxal-5-phosphate-dependent protein subunit beta [Candidatus Latescibacteria bacterium]|nr:pyridoxal-5-phosphate-dependent protein subunit beta [Candidatus Latescibacterota bacterium]
MSPSLKIVDPEVLRLAARRCRERGIVIPTLGEMQDPTLVPDAVRKRLSEVGLWDIDPVNLFRITWKNDPATGLYNDGNWIEFPPELTGVPARIVGLVGKWFPTGAHKVGAAFGCLVPRLITGAFDPTRQKAVWPSTGNYCRGGAFDSKLLACESVAILPEEMSRERFEWLSGVATEVIATPGCESNVKEIYDKCWEIKRTRPECVIFNQFEEWGNAQWHYRLTGGIVLEIFARIARPGDRLAAWVSATGSAGTLAAGDRLKTEHPDALITASEALQCPTLLRCGFGGHRIEGIGDKHVPWIHNVRNTDFVAAVDDQQCMDLLRLCNEPAGRETLEREGVPAALVAQLPLLGISGLSNLVSAIKTARHYDLDGRDVLFTPLTDSSELYASRLVELRAAHGDYRREDALRHLERWLRGVTPDYVRELNYQDRKQLHNFKYFTWVEQQQRDVADLRRLWDRDFWPEMFAEADAWDDGIRAFNELVATM